MEGVGEEWEMSSSPCRKLLRTEGSEGAKRRRIGKRDNQKTPARAGVFVSFSTEGEELSRLLDPPAGGDLELRSPT